MKKIIHQTINIISVLVLLYFAYPKILGLPQSVAGFVQFESVLGINADFFRLFTGFSELAMALLIVAYMLKNKIIIGKIAYLFLLATMLSALLIEFFVRPQPVLLLVVIAIVLSIFSIYKLKSFQTNE
ncbi:hypothetical protein MHL31_01605 [Lutibacter sp. A80]|uniref:hypothetical protein n=1 Tax=Lutibacter sp. A80 TaxID=2918453 RepID=UPI001F062070|nr:hypothetical protein [Lutibacter sp. A80]UMB60908.1 hypothetical protein MHL31_01605 [Lutibacter sp. A80]